MKRAILILGALALLLCGAGPMLAGTIYPVNDGFEVPNLGSGGYGYGGPEAIGAGLPALPSSPGTGWTFSGTTGIAANGSPFGVNGATNGNHDGTTSTSGQAGFIQGYTPIPAVNSISQTLNGFAAGTASVSFALELRGNNSNPIDVTLDGTDLGIFTATDSNVFDVFTTSAVPVTAGSHTLTFTGTNNQGGDNTEFIDNVSVTNTAAAVPEPATLTMLGIGIAGLAGYGWRRRKQQVASA